MLAVPAAARVACWLNAWIGGRESADAVVDGLRGDMAHVAFAGLDGEGELSPALLLGALRRCGVRRVLAALPTPGDPLGLAGPPPFNSDALDAGQAVVLDGASLGMVPVVTGRSTRWSASPAHVPAYLPDVAAADRGLRTALLEAAQALTELDVASWNPSLADELIDLRAPARLDTDLPLPSGPAARTAVNGLRCLRIVDLAFADSGGALSSWESRSRHDALVPLARRARAAVVAACSSLDGR